MIDYEETFNLSYWRVQNTNVDGASFFDAFYTRFLSSSEEVAALFANTDFEVQKNMLKLALVYVASFNPTHGPDSTMKDLRIRHSKLNVKAHHYALWLDCLLDTVKEYDPEYEEVVGEAWRQVLRHGIEFMSSTGSE